MLSRWASSTDRLRQLSACLDQAFEIRGIECAEGPVSEFLVLDEATDGSIVSSVTCARDNARTVRERISTELWEAINTLRAGA